MVRKDIKQIEYTQSMANSILSSSQWSLLYAANFPSPIPQVFHAGCFQLCIIGVNDPLIFKNNLEKLNSYKHNVLQWLDDDDLFPFSEKSISSNGQIARLGMFIAVNRF